VLLQQAVQQIEPLLTSPCRVCREHVRSSLHSNLEQVGQRAVAVAINVADPQARAVYQVDRAQLLGLLLVGEVGQSQERLLLLLVLLQDKPPPLP